MRKLPVLAACALLAACGRGGDVWLGYIEGDFLRLGPREAGLVTGLSVREGDSVDAGAALFAIDAERARLGVDEAQARLDAAAARAEDLSRGGRPEEIGAAEQALAAAQAELTLAQQDFTRTERLVAQDVAPRAQLDEDRRTLASAQARVAELRSTLDLVRAPAREDQIAAAQREAEAARAALALAQEVLGERTVAAPAAGRVDKVYLRAGEYAAPGQPVLSLLPPENIKAVFFVAQDALGGLAVGDAVSIGCDSCPGDLTGTVTHIAARAEFAPPVIYSEEARANLVFRVEARPARGASWPLNPGQPVEARIVE